MTKKVYMQPAIALDEFDMEEQLLVNSVTVTGLGENESIEKVEGSGDTWNDALSRRGAWDDGE